ncbi:hypothetical protein IQ07DRAFT_321592 [Pyrenochaeta sp. DS3sAY3a]|nr:hypothetical protein IQ07DRAFT_321592 [Pyrenochaeta sp. DS3sAY3a]
MTADKVLQQLNESREGCGLTASKAHSQPHVREDACAPLTAQKAGSKGPRSARGVSSPPRDSGGQFNSAQPCDLIFESAKSRSLRRHSGATQTRPWLGVGRLLRECALSLEIARGSSARQAPVPRPGNRARQATEIDGLGRFTLDMLRSETHPLIMRSHKGRIQCQITFAQGLSRALAVSVSVAEETQLGHSGVEAATRGTPNQLHLRWLLKIEARRYLPRDAQQPCTPSQGASRSLGSQQRSWFQ